MNLPDCSSLDLDASDSTITVESIKELTGLDQKLMTKHAGDLQQALQIAEDGGVCKCLFANA